MHIKKCIFRTTKVIKQGDPSQLFHALEFIFLDIHLRSRFSRPHAAFLAMANTSNFCQCHSLPRCMADIVLPAKFKAPRTRNSDALRVLEPGVPGAGAINFHAHCHCRVRSVFTLYDVLGTQSHRKTTRSAAECHIHGRQILRKKFQRGDGVLLSSLWNEISSHG